MSDTIVLTTDLTPGKGPMVRAAVEQEAQRRGWEV